MDNFDAKAFRAECEEWLKPYGYELVIIANNGTSLTFVIPAIDNEGRPREPSPAVVCYVASHGAKRMKIFSSGLKMFLELTTGEIQFKHPSFEKYLMVFRHYLTLIKNNEPF